MPFRVSTALHRRPGLVLALLLAPPLAWMGVVYLGSLLALVVQSFFHLDDFSGVVVRRLTLATYRDLFTPAHGDIVRRTALMAAAVTLADAVLAFPLAYYLARYAGPRMRAALTLAVLMPLWSSYLVKVYAWRTILSTEGILNWALDPFGAKGPGFGNVATWLVFTYLWLPFMIIPIYAGLERIPDSLISASEDLGASPLTTFRRVILPLTFPAVVAGSIFTFALTLGDYITPSLVSNNQFIGNVVYSNIVNNQPLASAFVMVPVVVMIIYLLIARRLGAFEHL